MLRNNILANFIGAGYGMLLQFLLLPVTLHYLGPQAYGLVGVYASILAILAVLDLGLSPALGRELARLSVLPNGNSLMRSTVTTLEIICLVAAISVGLLIWFGAPLLAKFWFTKTSLSSDLVSSCLQWMGVQSAFQFLTGYYNSGLVGMQRMVLSNIVIAFTQTLRTAVLLWLLMTNPQIDSYFIYQAAMSLIILIVTGYTLYFTLPKNVNLKNTELTQNAGLVLFQWLKKRYSHERFLACRRFAAGMAATTLSTLALTQLDKVILSKMLSLEDFGFYTIAGSIAGMLAKPASLVLTATLPRMTQLATSGDTATLTSLYLKSSALVSWMVLPVAGIFVGFSLPLLTFYLHNEASAAQVAPLFVLIAIGTACNASMNVPYGLTLAFGWAKFGVIITSIASIIMIPLIIISTKKYGAIGAAFSWMILNIGYFIFFMFPIHRKILKGILFKWYSQALVLQVFLAIVFAIFAKVVFKLI
jgi:O-antigen/teichoic acid export membrane protein